MISVRNAALSEVMPSSRVWMPSAADSVSAGAVPLKVPDGSYIDSSRATGCARSCPGHVSVGRSVPSSSSGSQSDSVLLIVISESCTKLSTVTTILMSPVSA